ncbi:MAG TPA: DnaJ domain-containing protein [Stenomitos sp.]
MSSIPDYYHVLGLSRHATRAEIKQAFRRLARQFHPDLNPQDGAAAARFRQIAMAYDILSDPQRRSRYDEERFGSVSSSEPPEPTYQALYVQGQENLVQREYQKAIANFSRAIALQPDSLDAYLGRCQANDALQADRAVLDDCYQLLRLNPQLAQAYLYQGRARSRLGYSKGACEAFTQAISLDADLAQAYYERAQAEISLQDLQGARQDLQKASELFRQQQSWSRAQQAERVLNGLPRTVAAWRSPLNQKHITNRNTIGSIGLVIRAIPQLLSSPNHNFLPLFAHFQGCGWGWVGVLYGLIAILGATLSSHLYPTGDPITAWKLGLAAASGYGVAVIASAIARQLAKGEGSWQGDCFVAGVAALPLAATVLLTRLALGLGSAVWIGVAVWGLSYSALMLYSGCIQINRMSESSALQSVPWILGASLLVVTLVTLQ